MGHPLNWRLQLDSQQSEAQGEICGGVFGATQLSRATQHSLGAPCSHQRTWAENEIFRMLSPADIHKKTDYLTAPCP
jgi:hypothetical protein